MMVADTSRRIWQNIYLRVLLMIGVVFLVLFVLRATRIAWGSFLIAFLIAYLAEPLVSRLERNRLLPRWLSVAVTVLLIVLFFVLGVVLVGEVLAQLAILPGIVIPFLNNLPSELEKVSPPWLLSLFSDSTANLQAFYEQQRTDLIFWLQGQGRLLVRGIGKFFGGLGEGLVIVVLAAFMISSYSEVQQSIYRLFPPRSQDFLQDLVSKLHQSVGGYVRAQVIKAIIVGLFVWLALLILGVPKAAAIAFLAAILSPIPYVGPTIALAIAVLSALTVSWQRAVVTFIVVIVINLLDGNVVQPLLFAQTVEVHPVIVLVVLIAGGELFGFWGILLSIPVAAFMQLIYRDYYLKSNWYLGRDSSEARALEDKSKVV
jgi:predicted PurR-regulated permease PerM